MTDGVIAPGGTVNCRYELQMSVGVICASERSQEERTVVLTMNVNSTKSRFPGVCSGRELW